MVGVYDHGIKLHTQRERLNTAVKKNLVIYARFMFSTPCIPNVSVSVNLFSIIIVIIILNVLGHNRGILISSDIIVCPVLMGCEIVGFGLRKLDSVIDLV